MSNRHLIKIVGHSSLVVAALVSLAVVWSLQPRGAGLAALASLWLLLPYAALAVVVEARPAAATLTSVTTVLLVVAGGLLFLIMVVFVNPDPQSGIAILLTPLYQGIATLILLPLTGWLFGTNSHPPAHRGTQHRVEVNDRET
jgi:hypothetical protein